VKNDAAGTEQVRAEASARQNWDAGCYARNARFVSDLGGPVIELLGQVKGLRILDIGCGDGALTERLAADGADVVAIDASDSQVAAARTRGLDARVADARNLTFESEFDAVFTNAALHWISPPEAVIRGVARALMPRGRFVGEFGGAGNVETVREALVSVLNQRGYDGAAADPWFFPSDDLYRGMLETGGFSVESAALIPRPTPIPGGLGDWIQTLAGSFLAVVPDGERENMISDVRDAVRTSLQQSDGGWSVDYVRLRFAAQLN
jgi:SAM-dependent methyltransferase